MLSLVMKDAERIWARQSGLERQSNGGIGVHIASLSTQLKTVMPMYSDHS